MELRGGSPCVSRGPCCTDVAAGSVALLEDSVVVHVRLYLLTVTVYYFCPKETSRSPLREGAWGSCCPARRFFPSGEDVRRRGEKKGLGIKGLGLRV